MKTKLLGGLTLAAASLSLPACHPSHAAEHGDAHHDRHTIVATSPVAKDVVVTQQYVCQIRAQKHIEVCALEGGRLEEIPIKEGQFVKKDELMFRVIPRLYQARLKAEEAEANVADLELQYSKSLAEKNAISPKEVALYEGKLAKAKVDQAKAELDFATVKAPFDGYVDRLERQLGSTIKEGEVLTTLSDTGLMWVYFNVPEVRYLEFMARREPQPADGPARPNGKAESASRLKLIDSQLELTLANGSTFKYPAGDTVTVEGKFNSETGNIPFRADFPNPERLLRHGQTGTVLIHQKVHGAVVIPQRATFEVLNKRYVFVVDDHGVVHQREVVVGNEMDDVYVVKSGVTPADKIILEGVRQVKDGQHVEFEFKPADEVLAHQKHPAE